MARRILRRVATFLVVLILVSFATTQLINLAPGSPCLIILGSDATQSAIAACEKQYGYNQAVLTQYWHWVVGALHGDLGTSVQAQEPVTSVLARALPISVEIAFIGFIGAMLAGIVLALWSALRPRGIVDRLVTAGSAIAVAFPPIVAAPLFVYVLAVKLHWFPPAGWASLSGGLGANLRHVALPAITLVVAASPLPLRLLRGDLAAVLAEDWIASARARGLPEWYVLLRHALRPASLSLLTISGVVFGYLVAGNVIVETFFTAPGIGYTAYFADSNHDIPVVQGVVVVAAIAYMVLNLLVDLCHPLLDPRLRGRRSG